MSNTALIKFFSAWKLERVQNSRNFKIKINTLLIGIFYQFD